MSTNIKSITFIKSDGSLLELSFDDCQILFNALSKLFSLESSKNPLIPGPYIQPYSPPSPDPYSPPSPDPYIRPFTAPIYNPWCNNQELQIISSDNSSSES